MPEETPPPPSREGDAAAPDVVDIDERLSASMAREKELFERLARLQADFENFRRRSREEAAQASARGKLDFVRAVIPVLDNLERALGHSDDEGLALLARQLQNALSAEGLTALDPVGDTFDAKVHEAIASEANEGVTPGTVVTTVEKGYTLDGKVVRPARVIVAA